MTAPALLQYQRPVPAEWTEALHAITPPFQRVSWLELLWESGEPGRSIHRWVIYEAIPAHAVTWWQKELLLEEPVQSAGHQRILDYFTATGGCLLQPFWVIQGNEGGHKVEFSDTEQTLLLSRNLPMEPPAAGELPYADFDQRVIRQVMKWDRLRQGYDTMSQARRLGDMKMLRTFREELVAWLEPQLKEAVREQHSGIEYSEILRPSDHEPDFDALTERYVETGQL